MDNLVTRIYKQIPVAKFDSLDEKFVMGFITAEEKNVFSTKYQHFTVNVPVTVSLMRDKSQSSVPFWLAKAGFVKTALTVKNEEYEYEVWQRNYNAGRVELGVNGFDKHRPVYFVTVQSRDKSIQLTITELYPNYALSKLTRGAFTYHDWSGLVLTEVPTELEGATLLTTVRGRAREAHVVNAFRKTIFPSSTKPDQIMLTWSGSPHSTIDIQWRTATADPDGMVRYWMKDSKDTLSTTAFRQIVEDRMLYNDRYVHRFTANLTTLKSGATYFYTVGSQKNNSWSDVKKFKTESKENEKFSFIWFGDTHCFPDSGKLITLAARNNDAASFYSIAGDIVSTGLHRNDWDKLFEYAGDAFSSKPLMPVPGNHDRQDGLGAQLYYDLFSLPKNGPTNVEQEASYSFEYGNAIFLMIDATSEVADHNAWIEEKLSSTKARWKFVMFHFPPYNFEEPYLDIQQAWVPLFDKFHVDMVMGGHIHYYMRSRPMHGGQVVPTFDKGTVYAISISIPSHHNAMTSEPYAVTQFNDGYFYQTMDIDNDALTYRAIDSRGIVRDEFTIRK